MRQTCRPEAETRRPLSSRPRGRRRQRLAALAWLACALPAVGAADAGDAAILERVHCRRQPRGPAPPPAALRAGIRVAGRTSRLEAADVVHLGGTIPPTFSRDMLGNSEGFQWHVSRHYALKTDLPETRTAAMLALLEMAYPHLEAIFGRRIAALDERRMAFVVASTRSRLERAMADDHLHALRLGGITLEGCRCACLYTGTPYHTRYILLHEAAHLYQHCLGGTTRQFHGFFIEGVADFFSSHVYDPARGLLTINVLDRAPRHNHLAAGLAEWRQRGRPSLQTLHEAADAGRGLDVLMTAFFQSTPEHEQRWRIYCGETIRHGRAGIGARLLSDRLIASLHGDWATLNDEFAAWMARRQPSFLAANGCNFDQHGDTLVSLPQPDGTPSPLTVLLQPPPGRIPVNDDPFRLDYPSTPPALPPPLPTDVPPAAPQMTCEIADDDIARYGEAGLGLGCRPSPAIAVLVSNAQWLVLAGEALPGSRQAFFLPPPAACAERRFSMFSLAVGSDSLEVAACRGRPPGATFRLSLPLAPSVRARLLENPAAALASRDGLRVTPRFRCAPAAADTAAVFSTGAAAEPAAATRFRASPALGRVYRAAWRLGPHAPTSLLVARNLLLDAAAGAAGELLSGGAHLEEGFWRGLAADVASCPADATLRQAALHDLCGIALDLFAGAAAEDGSYPFVAILRAPDIGAIRGKLRLRAADGNAPAVAQRLFDVRLKAGECCRRELPLRPPAAMQTLTADAGLEAEWLGTPLRLEARIIGRPGISLWHVLGPFPLPEGRFRDLPLPPDEEPLDLEAVFQAPDGTRLTWRPAPRPPELPADADHLLHFARLFGRQANRHAAYACATVFSPVATNAWLSLGASGGVRVTVNGRHIHSDLERREWAADNLRLPLRLSPGANEILVKSIHDEGLWLLSGRVEDEAGRPLPDAGCRQ